MSRVLVTGGTGFIGSWLCPLLERSGHDVHAVDEHSHGHLEAAQLLTGLLDTTQPDVVVHLAALVGRARCEDSPAQAVASNTAATLMLAQQCAERDIHLCYASTSEVYGDAGSTACYEEEGWLTPWQRLPHNTYALSKRWGEEAIRVYVPESRVTIWRLSMPYGPGLPPGVGRAAITTMLHNALVGEPLTVHRNARRHFCYVSDTVEAMRITMGMPGVFNVGRDDEEVTMKQCAYLALAIADHIHGDDKRELPKIVEVDAPPRQTLVKWLPTHQLEELGWRPKIGLEDGMVRTAEWLHTGQLPKEMAA